MSSEQNMVECGQTFCTALPVRKGTKVATSLKVPTQPTMKERAEDDQPTQPMLTDLGLYKCDACGKMVMGFEKEKHVLEVHKGKEPGYKKLR